MRNRRLGIAGLPVLLVLAALPVAARAAFVTDDAHLFSPDAVRRAEARFEEVYARTGKTVRIITVEALPAGSTLDAEAQRLFRAERINGVLVLIARRERGIAVRVGRYTAQAFGPAERGALLALLRRRFRAGEYDAGLEEAAAFIARMLLRAPAGSPAAPSTPAPRQNWLLPILLIAGGALVLGLILRKLSEPRAPDRAESAPPASPPVASPWGGFLGGMLGGLFGSWIGHNLWGPREVERPASPPTWQADDTLAAGEDVGESTTWDQAPDVGDGDSTQW